MIRSEPGRYLVLRLQLEGDGAATPSLESICVEYPRISLRRYLPAVFGEDPVTADFTDRFLAIFDTTLRGIERHLDFLPHLFDPLSTPAEPLVKGTPDFLSWLASWIDVTLDRRLSIDQRRALLKQAGSHFARRGTQPVLHEQLMTWLGFDTAGLLEVNSTVTGLADWTSSGTGYLWLSNGEQHQRPRYEHPQGRRQQLRHQARGAR